MFSRTVLTAAHCVCHYFDMTKNVVTRFCQYNKDHQNPTNQQTAINIKELNYIIYTYGNIDYTVGTKVMVDKAIVMKTEYDSSSPPHVVLNHNFDIGLLFAKTPIDPKSPKVTPLQLPPV